MRGRQRTAEQQRATQVFLSGFGASALAGAAAWLCAALLSRALAPTPTALPEWLIPPATWVGLTLVCLLGVPAVGLVGLRLARRWRPSPLTPAERAADAEWIARFLEDGERPVALSGVMEMGPSLTLPVWQFTALWYALVPLSMVSVGAVLLRDRATQSLAPVLAVMLAGAALTLFQPFVADRQAGCTGLCLPVFVVPMVHVMLPMSDLRAANAVAVAGLGTALVLGGLAWLDWARRGPGPNGMQAVLLTDRRIMVLPVGRGSVRCGETPLVVARAGRLVELSLGERGGRALLGAEEAEAILVEARARGWAVVEADGWHDLARSALAGRLRLCATVALVLMVAWQSGRSTGGAVVLQRIVVSAMAPAFDGRLRGVPSQVKSMARAWPDDPTVQAAAGLIAEAIGDAPVAEAYWSAALRLSGGQGKVGDAARARVGPGGDLSGFIRRWAEWRRRHPPPASDRPVRRRHPAQPSPP